MAKVRRDSARSADNSLKLAQSHLKTAKVYARDGRCLSALVNLDKAAVQWAYASMGSQHLKEGLLHGDVSGVHHQKSDMISEVARACMAASKLSGVPRRRRMVRR